MVWTPTSNRALVTGSHSPHQLDVQVVEEIQLGGGVDNHQPVGLGDVALDKCNVARNPRRPFEVFYRLPEKFPAELPLQRAWMLVPEEIEAAALDEQ